MIRLFIILILVQFYSFSQEEYFGTWTGIIARNNQNWSQGNTFSVTIQKEKERDRLEILSKEEINGTEFFGLAKGYGEIKAGKLQYHQVVYQEKKGSIRTNWCKLDVVFTYDSIKGYLNGDFVSSDCRQSIGKIILYRVGKELSEIGKMPNAPQITEKLSIDLKRNRNAPEIREIERRNFQFQAIYFDYDKDELKTEYQEFLLEMIDIVDGHSDLRIKVVGNTDSDGSDKYNEDLSKRRAQTIIDFFILNGLAPDRVEIDYNGEKKPADSNETDEGKQKNRRVEFMFI